MPSDALFGYDSSVLTPESTTVVTDYVEDTILNQDSRLELLEVVVTGYASSEGPALYNQELSGQRAEEVADLVAALLPGEVDITSDGRGEQDLIRNADGSENHEASRRVQISARFSGCAPGGSAD